MRGNLFLKSSRSFLIFRNSTLFSSKIAPILCLKTSLSYSSYLTKSIFYQHSRDVYMSFLSHDRAVTCTISSRNCILFPNVQVFPVIYTQYQTKGFQFAVESQTKYSGLSIKGFVIDKCSFWRSSSLFHCLQIWFVYFNLHLLTLFTNRFISGGTFLLDSTINAL